MQGCFVFICEHKKKQLPQVAFYQVFPWGVEPQSLEPESNILSIELREHAIISQIVCKSNGFFVVLQMLNKSTINNQ